MMFCLYRNEKGQLESTPQIIEDHDHRDSEVHNHIFIRLVQRAYSMPEQVHERINIILRKLICNKIKPEINKITKEIYSREKSRKPTDDLEQNIVLLEEIVNAAENPRLIVSAAALELLLKLLRQNLRSVCIETIISLYCHDNTFVSITFRQNNRNRIMLNDEPILIGEYKRAIILPCERACQLYAASHMLWAILTSRYDLKQLTELAALQNKEGATDRSEEYINRMLYAINEFLKVTPSFEYFLSELDKMRTSTAAGTVKDVTPDVRKVSSDSKEADMVLSEARRLINRTKAKKIPDAEVTSELIGELELVEQRLSVLSKKYPILKEIKKERARLLQLVGAELPADLHDYMPLAPVVGTKLQGTAQIMPKQSMTGERTPRTMTVPTAEDSLSESSTSTRGRWVESDTQALFEQYQKALLTEYYSKTPQFFAQLNADLSVYGEDVYVSEEELEAGDLDNDLLGSEFSSESESEQQTSEDSQSSDSPAALLAEQHRKALSPEATTTITTTVQQQPTISEQDTQSDSPLTPSGQI